MRHKIKIIIRTNHTLTHYSLSSCVFSHPTLARIHQWNRHTHTQLCSLLAPIKPHSHTCKQLAHTTFGWNNQVVGTKSLSVSLSANCNAYTHAALMFGCLSSSNINHFVRLLDLTTWAYFCSKSTPLQVNLAANCARLVSRLCARLWLHHISCVCVGCYNLQSMLTSSRLLQVYWFMSHESFECKLLGLCKHNILIEVKPRKRKRNTHTQKCAQCLMGCVFYNVRYTLLSVGKHTSRSKQNECEQVLETHTLLELLFILLFKTNTRLPFNVNCSYAC